MPDVAVDACCLINLLAGGRILCPGSDPSVAAGNLAMGLTLHVPVQVIEESLYLLKPDDENPGKLVKTPVDLAPYVRAGLLDPCHTETPEEIDLFVQLATTLDDGEAACLAIAKIRGWMLATDDRPAGKLAGRLGVEAITTPGLVRRWAERTGAGRHEVATLLRSIQTFARFIPRHESPGYAWWIDRLEQAEGGGG